jgi:hypothetical protein
MQLQFPESRLFEFPLYLNLKAVVKAVSTLVAEFRRKTLSLYTHVTFMRYCPFFQQFPLCIFSSSI